MKKSLVAALTGALVVGATATTFAAANPFSDVPAGHWAYNAVTRLASEGVIEGYGDGTYRGNRNITRYEMAQMVARALSRAPQTTISSSGRADLDKLAAEFRDELDNLGVRVSDLERNADKVKWAGKIEYTYGHFREENDVDGSKTTGIGNGGVFRLEPVAEVNDHWNAVARFDASFNIREDSTGDSPSTKLKRVYGEGKYDKFSVKLGRFGFCPGVEDGMVVDTVVSGGELSFGSKWKFTVTAGRVGKDSDEAHYYGGPTDRLLNSLTNTLNGVQYYIGSTKDQDAKVVDTDGKAQNILTALNIKYQTGVDEDGKPVYSNRDVMSGADYLTLGKFISAFKDVDLDAQNVFLKGYKNGVEYVSSDKTLTSLPGFLATYKSIAGEDFETALANDNVDATALDEANAAGLAAVRQEADDAVAEVKKNISIDNAYPTDIVGINVGYDSGEPGLYGVASFYHAKDKDFRNYFYSNDAKTDKANVWAANLGYRFSDDLKLWGGYAKNSKADNENSAWQAEVRYGNYGDYAEQGDWAIWAGYAKFGYNTAIASSQGDDVQTGTKGWHIGAAYAPFKNVGLLVRYSDGEYITSGDKYRKIFARGEWFF